VPIARFQIACVRVALLVCFLLIEGLAQGRGWSRRPCSMEHRARRRDSRAAVELAARAAEDFAGEVILVRLQDQARKPFEVLTLEARPLLILEKSAKAATAN
jgi:hypothetical protein